MSDLAIVAVAVGGAIALAALLHHRTMKRLRATAPVGHLIGPLPAIYWIILPLRAISIILFILTVLGMVGAFIGP